MRLADEAIEIGPAAPERSYLNIEAIVSACKASGAEAVHPGYGFLSERAAFAEALEREGIVFIGPNANADRRLWATRSPPRNSPAPGGSLGRSGFVGAVVADAAEAERIAEGDIGYPVMIKASAGGGGRGMRVAVCAGQLARRSRAQGRRRDPRLAMIASSSKNTSPIRAISRSSCSGDRHGAAIHLGERECSIQRRNQKVIEEAPSPFIDEAMREAMGGEAVALARAINYDLAGTIEFIVDRDRRFYFLEMNTRLQVEHPVTDSSPASISSSR